MSLCTSLMNYEDISLDDNLLNYYDYSTHGHIGRIDWMLARGFAVRL